MTHMVATQRRAGMPAGQSDEGREPTSVHIRPATPADVEACGRIIYEAFLGIAEQHQFPPDFPTVEAGTQLASLFINHPAIFGVVAESDGEVVGSNFLDERDPIRGLGPITVDPRSQARGIGRRLMQAVLDRAAETPGTLGVRLLQDSFNTASLALYASLGFAATEPVVVMSGRPRTGPDPDVDVRPMTDLDLAECEALHRAVHGYERTAELQDALTTPGLAPVVARRGGQVVAYATTLTSFAAAYAVARSEADLAALIAGALVATDAPASFLLPIRQHQLFRWCLEAGLRVVKPMTYMAYGPRTEADGAWLPSVLA